MAQLTKGIYEPPYDHERPFGLHNGQCILMRQYRAIKNAGWYNKAGEKLGWGDLSFSDMQAIADGLEENEVFVVLSEQAWRINLMWEGLDDKTPGVEYVLEYAHFIIAPKRIYCVDRFHSYQVKLYQKKNVRFRVISREKARALVLSCAQ